ncbi:hypothetical protein ALC56_13507 [Trachymyrmex septentrionalis]|uniref:Uncharacterized protein n=1 Tax=Trachymyrmex septentrionalis TaxID=34720 RepID=A0A195EW62_9HYME|nr:hypothetical protein ALC56_13507 [Trachymyrmex septentrionalis]
MLIDPAVDPRAFRSPLYLLVETGDRGESYLIVLTLRGTQTHTYTHTHTHAHTHTVNTRLMTTIFAKAPYKLTALCYGIPCVGVRVRAVQSSQNPEKAPGFTRAAVGETPRNSRIRLSPNIFCIRVVKDSRRYTALLLCGNDKGRLQRIGTFVIYPVDPGFCRM